MSDAEPIPDSDDEIEDLIPDVTTTKLYDHCRLVYTGMSHEAVETSEGRVYVGKLTGLFDDLELGQPYYTAVTRKLKAMGCIKQLRRGGGTTPSQWLLLQEPEPRLFMKSPDRPAGGSTNSGSSWPLQKQINDLNKRLVKAEDKIEYMAKKLL